MFGILHGDAFGGAYIGCDNGDVILITIGS